MQKHQSDTEKTRRFGGKTTGFTSKEEQQFFTKMLKAYHKGHKHFRHGNHPETNVPLYFKVIELWK